MKVKRFEIGLGLHQGSTLSPLRYIIELDMTRETCRTGLPLESLYAGDLSISAKVVKQLEEKVRK